MHHILRCFIRHPQFNIQLIQFPDVLTSGVKLIPSISNQHSHPNKRKRFRRDSSNAQRKRGIRGFYGFFRSLKIFFQGVLMVQVT